MNLSIGSSGPQVRELQDFLNLLPTSLQPLSTDGQFGLTTRGRVQEFQRSKRLAPDGVVGPLTMDAIMEVLRLLGLLPVPPAAQTVRPINQQILGMAGTDNLIPQIF